jgi:Cu(I)/Ag(I) efflux system membrane fusion protein
MRKAAYIAVPVLMLACFFAGRHFSHGKQAAAADPHRILYYVDPMHPAYKSDKPGIAPDCGMQLEPVYAESTPAAGTTAGSSSGAMASEAINISPEQQQLAGIRVEPVVESSGAREVRVLGRVVADEARLFRVNAATDGYIQDVFNFTTGSMVKKNEELATFGTAELLTTQQSFLGATMRSPETRNEVISNDWRTQNRAVYASRLRALGMSEMQLKELTDTMKLADSIKILSPATGFVLARNVSPGQRYEKGAELYRIADLSRVWIVADVYESEAQDFHQGTIATVTLPNQKKSLHARVSGSLPQFDPATRTMKLRLEAANPGFFLRPDMFVDVELPVHIPAGLTVPVDSLLDSGLKKRVFVQRGNGYFEAREVETGWRFGDRVQVVSGLVAGERIVVSGTFLVDSESRLKGTRPRAAEEGGHGEAMPEGKALPAPKLKTQALPTSAKDPSCGMDVTPAESVAAGNIESYRGKTYYFCSSSCRDKFHRDPAHSLHKSQSSVAGSPDGATMQMPMAEVLGHP